MKKSLCFILNKMSQGGPQRSVLNLISLIDFSLYDITIVLFDDGGELFHQIPKNVRIRFVEPYNLYNKTKLNFNVLNILFKVLIRIIIVLLKTFHINQYLIWKIYEPLTKKQNTRYDLAIAYLEGYPIYYLSSKVSASIKIARIPTDYKAAKLNKYFDYKYLESMDYIFAISDETANILMLEFPDFKNKIEVFELITPKDTIQKMCLIGAGFSDDFNGKRILTLGRLDYSKGIDLAIQACEILIKKGYNIRWYYMGSGNKIKYNKEISNKNLDNHFKILDSSSNPYKYLYECDLYVQPSRYEGKGNAINEAKCLCKPIIITRFPTSHEIIENGISGLIVDLDSQSISEGIIRLIIDDNICTNFSNFHKIHFNGNENDLLKLLCKIR